MGRPYALLRAGFPYVRTLGMRRLTTNPVDLAIGEGGRLYVLCRSEGALGTHIRRFTWEDEDLDTISEEGTEEGQLLWPVAIIADREENLYVSDEGCHRISSFDREGALLGCWGEQGDGDGQLNRPSGIAFDADENVYVVDTLNHRIQKFTKDGRFQMKWGGFGAGDGELNMPWGITVDELGYVYVADWRNDRVQKFTANGDFVFTLGTSGAGDGQLNRPTGVAVDKDGDIYVADRGNNRVQLFSAEGRYVEKFIGDATLSRSARDLVRANQMVLRFREMTCLEPQKRLRGPISVRVDDGRMYIADYGAHRIQVYQKEAYPLGPDEIAPPMSPSLMTI